MRMERFEISGALIPERFVPWIERHADRLGTVVTIERADPAQLVLLATAQPEQLDALEMGCLLGPIDVWVDRIDRVVQL